MVQKYRDKLIGVVISLPTWVDEDHNLLLKQQKRHIEWLVEKGITTGEAVILGAGGLGEGYFLSDEEWYHITGTVAEAADGKVPTMMGIFELSAREAAKKAQYAAEAGIDFIQLAPPHYMVPSEDDVFYHYEYVNDRADIGIMAYNVPWAMPQPGFDFTEELIHRFLELEHVAGIKWSSFNHKHYLRVLRTFHQKLNFIDNMMIFSLGAKLGMKGFIDFHANAAPRLSLHLWELLKAKKYDEFDELYLKIRFDPYLKTVTPEMREWVGVGEGPTTRLTCYLLGLDAGPFYPAQAPLSEEYIEGARKAIENSGTLDWVDWDQKILEE